MDLSLSRDMLCRKAAALTVVMVTFVMLCGKGGEQTLVDVICS